MLVSAISSFRAIAMQHNAGMAMMQNNQNNLSMLRASRAGETNFNALHQQDVRNSVSTAKNQLMYQVASAWKKQCEAKMKQEMKQNKLNYMA